MRGNLRGPESNQPCPGYEPGEVCSFKAPRVRAPPSADPQPRKLRPGVEPGDRGLRRSAYASGARSRSAIPVAPGENRTPDSSVRSARSGSTGRGKAPWESRTPATRLRRPGARSAGQGIAEVGKPPLGVGPRSHPYRGRIRPLNHGGVMDPARIELASPVCRAGIFPDWTKGPNN